MKTIKQLGLAAAAVTLLGLGILLAREVDAPVATPAADGAPPPGRTTVGQRTPAAEAPWGRDPGLARTEPPRARPLVGPGMPASVVILPAQQPATVAPEVAPAPALPAPAPAPAARTR